MQRARYLDSAHANRCESQRHCGDEHQQWRIPGDTGIEIRRTRHMRPQRGIDLADFRMRRFVVSTRPGRGGARSGAGAGFGISANGDAQQAFDIVRDRPRTDQTGVIGLGIVAGRDNRIAVCWLPSVAWPIERRGDAHACAADERQHHAGMRAIRARHSRRHDHTGIALPYPCRREYLRDMCACLVCRNLGRGQ